ncbi:DUF4116 domain-containing protein, partial [Aliarcobacter skirrowii]|uniref:DUF4116 domain-containing protein n=1 Tax=Aliarcobacter skirrowii TaxID=28200 RepID=UPI000A8E978A
MKKLLSLIFVAIAIFGFVGCAEKSQYERIVSEHKQLKIMAKENPLKAVRQNGYAIRYIKNPSEEVQLEAVKRNVNAIEYIKNPSEKVQLEAVK